MERFRWISLSTREQIEVVNYMSLAFYHMIAKWGRLVTSVRKGGKGILNAAAPSPNNPTPSPHSNIRYLPSATEIAVRNLGSKNNVPNSRRPPVRVDGRSRLP